MDIYLTNTLSRKKEKFIPLKTGHAKMYNCGPTVYDRQHIGNLRSAVIWDTLRRTLEYNGLKVTQVVNITDFGHLTSDADEGEDKMAKGLKREGLPFTLDAMRKLAEKYTSIYIEDRKKLNLLAPTYLPFASDHIVESIKIIQELQKKDFAYVTEGAIYFDVAKYPDYGKLSNIHNQSDKQSRISTHNEKKDLRDFALWKFNKNIGFDSPWGIGFPGWHIECSAMSWKYLGETFDIHTGGIEHIDIHHENEIAQSENFTGKKMANFWLHNEHLLMRSGKMAKSIGNVVNLSDIEKKGFSPLSYRYLMLNSHYRSKTEFSFEALNAAENAVEKLKKHVLSLKYKKKDGSRNPRRSDEFRLKFQRHINDDLDTPKAIALLWQMLKDKGLSSQDKLEQILDFDRVLGLRLDEVKELEIPKAVQKLIDQRNKARDEKDWQKADELRERIKKFGIEVEDDR